MRKTNKLLLSTVLALAIPAGAMAAEVDLQAKLDKLSQQMEDLKGQVQRIEDKSLGKWLQIGGSYQFRMDSLHGKTAAYTDVMSEMNYLGKNALYDFAALSPTNPYFGAGLTGTIGYNMTSAANMMQNVKNYSQATAIVNTPFGAMPLNVYMRTALPMMYAAAAAEAGITGATTNPAGTGAIAAYKPKNETIYTNKFALDLKAKATKDVTVNVKLGMYKVFGSQDDKAIDGNAYFSDRVGIFDGVLGHVPSSSYLNVDRAYATWSNIMEQPVWLSVGRRPSTDGAPTNLKSNNERPGNGGTPALLVNYAFDGMTLGYAPDIDMLPGFYAKVCYGRGFDSGFRSTNNQVTNSLKDTDMLGVAVIPVDTDPLRVWFQWNRGFNIFDFPVMQNTAFGNTAPSTNLGSIDWFGLGGMSTLKKVGPGDLNFFVDGGLSVTHPTTAVSGNAMFQGLLTGSPFNPEAPSDKTGYAVFAGVRYDLPSKTKLGFEFNYGSKNWITFSPAADDMWTSKVGTRGKVYEPYIIQELDLKPISSVFAKTFFKLGYQYYDFEYTGSNNWVGAPIKISDIKPTDFLLMAPVKEAHNIYGTFEVHF
jgi:opacity protein-like surface antigen